MPINVNGTACTLAGGVRETSNTTGTGDYSLNGAATIDGITYRTFVAAIGNGINTVYRAQLGSEYEHGIGTVLSPSTLTRAAILSSSNGGNAVNWATTDPKDIWCDAAAAVFHSIQAELDDIRLASGTQALFYQAAAPANWTQVVTQNDKVLRVVSGSGGGSAGSWTISGVTVDGHSLTEAELAAHRHHVAKNTQGTTTPLSGTNELSFRRAGFGDDDYLLVGVDAGDADIGDSSISGSGAAHTHGLSSDGSWRPAYIDVIICSKD